MRAFVGIDFDNQLKTQIAEVQSYLKSLSIKGRWKYIDNFHLTLKFLDEISEQDTLKIKETLTLTLKNFSAFSLNIESCGYFKGKDYLRVVYLQPNGEIEKLMELFDLIDNSLSLIGFQKEKRVYTPHITIAQDVVLKSDFDVFSSYVKNIKFYPINVSKIILFKSEEVERKRLYTPIFVINLHEA